jgi:hypothetical protein
VESKEFTGDNLDVVTAVIVRNTAGSSDLTGKQAEETVKTIMNLAQLQEEASKIHSKHIPSWNHELSDKGGFELSESEISEYQALLGFIANHMRSKTFIRRRNSTFLLEVDITSALCGSLGISFWRGLIGYKKRLMVGRGFNAMAVREGDGTKLTFSLTISHDNTPQKNIFTVQEKPTEVDDQITWDNEDGFEQTVQA